MFSKCATAIIIAAITGAVLLGLRQQRFETMHDMAKLHAGMNTTRQTIWNLQTRVAGEIQPARLQDAITQANLPFETFTPSSPVHPQVVANQKNYGMNLLKTTPSDIDLAGGQPTPGPEHIATVSNKPQKPATNKTAPAPAKKNNVVADRRDTGTVQFTTSHPSLKRTGH